MQLQDKHVAVQPSVDTRDNVLQEMWRLIMLLKCVEFANRLDSR